MSDVFDILQDRYQALVARKQGEDDEEEGLVEDMRTFIIDARQAGASVADLDERSQLRAWMRFLAEAVYDATDVYPDVTLEPLARGQLTRPQPAQKPKPSPALPLAWMLTGGAAVAIIAAGLFLIGWLSRPPEIEEEPPTPMPAPFVSYAAVGAELEPGGTVRTPADTFCRETPEIVAEFALERIEPGTKWRWEVQRDGSVVASQPAAPWGTEAQRATVRALTGGPDGVEPGQYDLRIIVDEQVVGMRSFQVLDVPSGVSDIQVSDVPGPDGPAAGAEAFEPGVRVIYLTYAFEGLCPGLEVSHALHREGEPVQERVEVWDGGPQGRMQVAFPAPADLPFPPGEYETTISIAGEEQVRVGFTIGAVETETVDPTFGDVTVALGVQADGTPILAPADNRFDWNTKVIYGIFDYVGMTDGLRWTAVWTRSGQEVAREENLWDVELDGTEGTHWVTYQNERGQVLPGGSYSVTLYIQNVAQRTADFNVLYYVPPAE